MDSSPATQERCRGDDVPSPLTELQLNMERMESQLLGAVQERR